MKNRLFFFCLLISLSAFGQKLYQIQVAQDSFAFKVSVNDATLTLVQSGNTDLFKPKKGFSQMKALQLEDADLILEYLSNNGGGALTFNTQLTLKTPDGTTHVPTQSDLADVTSPIGGRRLVWYDMTEFLTDFDGTYTLHVRRSLMGAVNCDAKRPKFSFMSNMPYNYIGISGGLMLVVGQLFRGARNDDYADYKRLWTKGAPDPILAGYGDPLSRAKTNGKNAKVCTWMGLYLLTANAGLVLVMHKRIKQRQHLYDQFCVPEHKNSLLLSPSKNGVGIVLNF